MLVLVPADYVSIYLFTHVSLTYIYIIYFFLCLLSYSFYYLFQLVEWRLSIFWRYLKHRFFFLDKIYFDKSDFKLIHMFKSEQSQQIPVHVFQFIIKKGFPSSIRWVRLSECTTAWNDGKRKIKLSEWLIIYLILSYFCNNILYLCWNFRYFKRKIHREHRHR